ncbi:MAG: redoxin domain-containing protein [Planctomycetes bacterium]|nr:redoxin domain-containing protein [Planctomycetota bacterium]
MFQTACLLLALAASPAAGAPLPDPAVRAQEPSAKADPLDAEFAKLMEEAQEASQDYAQKRKTDPKTPPWQSGMWDKFQALAAKGHGRSLLWLAQNAQHKYEGKKETTQKKLELYGQLIEKHGSASWSDEIVDLVVKREKKYFRMQEMDTLLTQLKTTSKNREAQAAALNALCSVLSGTSAGESERKRAEEYKAELEKNYQDTAIALRMNLAVGKSVPDIEGKDVEGVAFKLSDYKGKVVLLDFWGFW